MIRRMTFVAVGFATFAAGSAKAQTNPDSVKLRNDCRLAVQVISTGNPAPHLEWARSLIGNCGRGEWAKASSAAVRRLRTSTDPNILRIEWRNLWMLRDADLFAAAGEIAGDPSSSTLARLWALRTLANYVDPEGVYVLQPSFGASQDVPACISNRRVGSPHITPAKPLPTDFAQQTRDMAHRITSKAGADVSVRAAAWCVQRAPVHAVWVP